MAVFVVIPTEDKTKEKLEKIISSTFGSESFYALPDKNAFFVQFNGTSSDFAIKLNLMGNEKDQNTDYRPCTAVVTNLGIYSGFGPSSLWEWLKSKG